MRDMWKRRLALAVIRRLLGKVADRAVTEEAKEAREQCVAAVQERNALRITNAALRAQLESARGQLNVAKTLVDWQAEALQETGMVPVRGGSA